LEITQGGGQSLYASDGQQEETFGFCTNLLSALAVSSAGNQAQFQQYSAAAVRLAALIGALIDAQDVFGEHWESTSFATICISNQAKTKMTRIMKQFPKVIHIWISLQALTYSEPILLIWQANISANYDEARVL